ncbi:Spatacsin [Bagarius yarrelli]|uniref:Spatacsin n=1 Tax=Bagarius yarrelli TaxID=175774 RepID=A0A556THW3_BAGYA|nr:Spatacsin [Bagarius yarrelli]
MLSRTEVGAQSAVEVALVPDSVFCTDIARTVKAAVAADCSLICYLNVDNKLMISDVSETGTLVHVPEDSYTDFLWEVSTEQNRAHKPRLLTLRPACNLRLDEIDSERQLAAVAECFTDRLLQYVSKDLNGSKIASTKLLSFANAVSHLLLNGRVLVHLRWLEDSAEPELWASCALNLPSETQDMFTDYQFCKGVLFMLTSSGLIYVFDSLDGTHLATVDLPAYYLSGQKDREPIESLSDFCLLNVSQDFSTVVTTTRQNQALAVDLNDYFRIHKNQLHSQQNPTPLPFIPAKSCDQDSVESSAYSQSVLGTHFQTDQSWEAKLAMLYKQAKVPDPPALQLPWYKDLPRSECRKAAATAKLSQCTLPSGGAVMSFTLPEQTTQTLLNVSEFSAVLSFTTPSKSSTTLVYWDLETQSVIYHHIEVPAVPVCWSEEEHLALILKVSGLSMVLFKVSQEELLNRLMVFGSAGMVDSLCHLNAWGRCSMPIHSLQAGLKNRQLDMVDFFLKSKENILCPPTSYSLPEQLPTSTKMQLNNIQDLCPALDLLQSAIRDTYAEAQSRQFCEQLLGMTLNFLNTQIRVILSSTPELDTNLHESVKILNGHISELRSYLRKYPWVKGVKSQTFASDTKHVSGTAVEEDWDSCSVEEIVQRAVLNRELPRAQAYMRKRNCPEQKLEELRKTGLRLAFTCLTQRDLQQATILLTNMGFNVKEQFYNICVYTADRELRAFMVEELQRLHHLSIDDLHKVEFIKQIENVCSRPAMRGSKPFDQRRVLQKSQSEAESRNLLQELLPEPQSCSVQSLIGSARLDWVRHWDNDTQKSVLLSRISDHLLGSCDPAVLWSYFTSLHDQDRVTAWLTHTATQDCQSSAASKWPVLTAAVVDENTKCSNYMKDQILDMLARQEVFVQSEMSDFEQLLWRLGQARGVMRDIDDPPVPQFRSSDGKNFHTCFIQYCLENNLQYLLYTYLQHYRLTPSNCPAVGDSDLYELYPWFEMMVKLQSIPRDLENPEQVFQASLTSAQVLLPGSQASVSSMLLEGHSLLALSTIMFAPGGIDRVVTEGDKGGDVLSRVDPQLLRMALSAYPKLKAALFPQTGLRVPSACDVSIYHLMQSLHPLDTSKLFGWQSANTLGTADTSAELPHFSSPHLVNNCALVENLDFLYYLQHGRPSFAYGIFIIQHLSDFSNAKLQMSQALEQAYTLGLLNFSAPPVAAACVCFFELLGVCSLKLRVDLKALNLILKLWRKNCEESSMASLKQSLVDKVSKVVAAERQTLEELLLHLEEAVNDIVESRGIGRSSYEAGQEWTLPVQFCHLHDLPLSNQYLQDCATDGQWLNFLLFIQIHQYPPQQVKYLAASFSPGLQAHLFLAFQDIQMVHSQQAVTDQKDSLCSLIKEGRSEHSKDLFQVLFQSQEQPNPWQYLLAEAVALRSPPLTVLAACYQESPLIHMLLMYELCYDHKNYQGAKDKLMEFQKCLLNLRNSGSVLGSECLPVQWVEAQASVLLLTLLQQCGTQYELCKLLQLLADMERMLKSNGPDFKKLSLLSQILADTPVPLSPCLLDNYTTQSLQRECQRMLEELQDLGLFCQARKVAELAGLPIDRLIINELLRNLTTLKTTRQWERQETRLAFWRKCQQQFKTDCIEAESACQFFLSQAEQDSVQKDTDLLQVQEQCLLLALAAHWLCQQSPPALDRLAVLEKQQWKWRICRMVLTTALEQQSLFIPATGPDAFDSLLKEYSFSKISSLDDQAYLNVDGLPTTGEACLLEKEEEQKALFTLHWSTVGRGECSRSQSSSSTGSLSSFVVVSSPEDQVLSQLQLLVDECRHGKSYCKQVLSLYELSKELHCSYSEISSEEPEAVLRKVLISQQPERFKKAQAFISVQGLQPDSVAQLLTSSVLDGLLASSQDRETAERHIYSPLEGKEAFLQLAKLCGDPNLVGIKLLDMIPTVPLAEVGCTVELLILAHDCFSLTCNMEGIVKVLQAARHLSHTHLAHGERYGLLVRLLTGIGRYNEMTYIFDLLIQNHRFEMLLRKKVESNTRLKTALLDYIKRCLPGDSEKYNMVALCFSMRREIGENHEGAARTQLKLIESQPWAVTPELKTGLEKVLFLLKDAAESYSKCVKMAKLITLQLYFLNHGQDLRVVNLRPSELLSAMTALPRCYQSFIVAEAYDYSPDWAEILYQKVILKGDFPYLEEFKLHRPLPSSLFEDISKKLMINKPPNTASQNLKKLLQYCENVYIHYKLAYEHNFHDVANTLLQDSKTSSYLNDRLSS